MRAVAFGFRQRNRIPFVAIKAEVFGKERGSMEDKPNAQ
jgi:hypothetical protein